MEYWLSQFLMFYQSLTFVHKDKALMYFIASTKWLCSYACVIM